jgi:capsular polysaccharide biosynthesis protein
MVRAKGFHVVYPEAHNLAEQCALFHGARAIIGPSGSGMLNAAFAPEGTKLADLEGYHHTVRQHAKLYSSSGKIYGFAFGETFRTHPSTRAFDNWTLAPHLLSGALDAIT